VDALDVARLRLRRSSRTAPRFETAAGVVHHHGAMQAQEEALSKWSVGERARRVTEAGVDEAIATGASDGSSTATALLRLDLGHLGAP
jgi:hypothetical protein